jgi:hypothetical protein
MIDLLRYSHDVYGQTKLEGVSWDLLPIFFYGALILIVLHLIYAAVSRRKH